MKDTNNLLGRIEKRQLWAYFHKDWLLQIRSLIRPQLPSEYYVFVESETILISPPEGAGPAAMMPDIGIARAEPKRAASADVGKATAAVLEVEEPCELFPRYILLIRRAPENRLVAALEILSPSNKGTGSAFDKEKYLRKREQYLDAGVNLLEIDALLSGERIMPPPLGELGKYQRHAWTVCHDDGLRRFRGWGWNPNDPLPTIPWDVESSLQILVDLPEAFEEASQFNQWEELVGRPDT